MDHMDMEHGHGPVIRHSCYAREMLSPLRGWVFLMLLFAQEEVGLAGTLDEEGGDWRVVQYVPYPVPTRHRLPRCVRLERLIWYAQGAGSRAEISEGESEREQTKTLLRSAMYPGPLLPRCNLLSPTLHASVGFVRPSTFPAFPAKTGAGQARQIRA